MSNKSPTDSALDDAEQALRKNRRAEAVSIYHQIRESAPADAGIQYRLGRLAFNFGDVDQAAEHFASASDGQPDNADYLSALGVALQQGGRIDAAMTAFRKSLQQNPEQPDALNGMGVCLLTKSRPDEAVDFLERAVRVKPGHCSIRTNLSTALSGVDRHEEAVAHARKAIAIDDSDAGAHYALCKALTETGQMDETVRHLESTIRRHRGFGPAYDLLARIRKFTADDDALIARAEKALDLSMPPLHRYSLQFALGKMHADRGDYDASFRHYESANRLQDPGYDLQKETRLVRDLKHVFDRTTIERLAASGHPSQKPVFIIGMPRSGTTLMEQLIAAHPRGAGAGELNEIGAIAARVFPEQDRRKIRRQLEENLTPSRCREFAEGYLDILTRGREDAERIVDKMPSNFFFVGLIAILFPQATIIHAVRNPLDVGVSCFRQNFASLYWTNSLENIAAFYRLYRDTMAFWEKQLPDGRIVELRYESLVEDPKTEARRLLEACGLEWTDDVLEFFRRKGVVKTASIAQVRQPVYKTSQRNWIRYAAHIGPLAEGLAPYLADDRELLAEHGIRIPAGRRLLGRLFG